MEVLFILYYLLNDTWEGEPVQTSSSRLIYIHL